MHEVDPNTIVVGALLPFTGKEAAIGANLEQALLMAIDDVNAAGGVDGRPLHLITRDSNSGSDRGFQELLQLLYTDKVEYLIGPEETELVTAIVPDVKGLNVLNILPGYTPPAVQQTGAKGGWIRLAPSTWDLACAMSKHVVSEGVTTMNALVTRDEYNSSVASDFISLVGTIGGRSLPSISVPVGAQSYARSIDQVLAYGADITLLMAPPASASTITTEWTIDGRRGNWYLSPLLHAEAFLQNIPFGTLNGAQGISPSLSLTSECKPGEGEEMICTDENSRRFSKRFAEHWHGDRPFPSANFYYDAVVLLSLGLEKGLAESGTLPKGRQLRDYIRELGDEDAQPASWHDLAGPMTEIRLGTPIRYVGAAAEYSFDAYGGAVHSVFDTWTIDKDAFVDTGSRKAICPKTI